MPYIPDKRRALVIPDFYEVPQSAGELNFVLTNACFQYLKQNDKMNYQLYNDVIGALDACKLEFYRRLVSSYEDEKIRENGDVY
jgi:hypothetical protein